MGTCTKTTPHKHLHHYGCRYTFCSATAVHRYVHHYGSNGYLRVALHHKCWSDLVITFTVMKRESNKVYSLDREKQNVVRRERADLEWSFSFSGVVLTLRVHSHNFASGCKTHFRGSLQNGGRKYQAISHWLD